jgi:hypothetical protein
MKLQLEEYEWSKNENNPTVKAQILANKFSEIDLQYYDEAKQTELATLQAELEQALTIAKYAPAQAEAELNRIYAEINQLETETQEMKNQEETGGEMTAGQMGHYNTILTNLKSLFADDPNASLAYAETNKKAYISSIGEAGYKQLVEAPNEFATAEPETKEPVYEFK